jgi:hypothetical protein
MGITLVPSAGSARIRLPESVTVNCITELHGLFLEAISGKRSIEIDFERTTELDACAVQLLYRACLAAGRSNLTVRPAGAMPEPVEKTFRELGLDPFQRASKSLGQ